MFLSYGLIRVVPHRGHRMAAELPSKEIQY